MNEERGTTTSTDNVTPDAYPSRHFPKWLIIVGVLLVTLLAEALRSRSVATDIVRAGAVKFTEHVSTRPQLSRYGIRWSVTFRVPPARLHGQGGPVSAESTLYVSWSDTWDKKGAIYRQSQQLYYR